MKSKIVFGDEEIKLSFDRLKTSKTEDQRLYRWLNKAFDDLKENAFCGIQLSKRLIPKVYIKEYGIDNLWKYDFPKGWRLLYSIGKDKVMIISIILRWLDHKNYERRFNY